MNLRKMLKREMTTIPPEIEKRNDAVELQIAAKFADNHFHFVMNDDNEKAREFIEAEAAEIGLDIYANASQNEAPEKVVFHNRQAIGDILTFTAGVRDFKKAFPNTEVGVISTAMHLWDHNPNINIQLRDEEHILKIGPGYLTNKSNSSDLHMANAFRLDIENKLGLKIPQGPIRPDIWMTEEEYKAPPLIDGPYWVFIYGGEPGWPAKQYHRWQEVINLLKDDVQIVQMGVKGHPYPHLDNVIDYVGKTEDRNTGIRQLFNIFLHAQGSLGLVSMHMHLSAAFGNPCVVLAAAREPASFTQYFGHQYIHTNGTMFCGEHTACWKCKMDGCRNKVEFEGKEMPKCVEIIEPEDIAAAVRKYYKGGRLEYGKKVPNKFFKNIVKEPNIFVAPKIKQLDNEHLEKWGFQWGGSNMTDRDWIFIKGILEEYKIKSILDFGAGLSTLLMGLIADKVITLESNNEWIQKMINLADPKKHLIKHWDGKTVPLETLSDYKYPDKYDFAFVDGPVGGENREWSTKYASEHADLIIVHDAGRVAEKKWQAKYLEEDFQLIAKGGHRCHLWQRKECIVSAQVDETKPLARMITTCRGWGGSERSTCYIMQGLLDKGYRVELNPTGNISGEYLSNIPKGVIQKRWPEIREPADVAIFYTSDCIWNFNKPEYKGHMPHLNAKRKIMVLNYKIGGAGTVDWTFGWDKYMFLNSMHEEELLKRIEGANTKVLAPPTALEEFFKVQPVYDAPLKLIRHSSQGDNKHPENTNEMIRDILRVDSSIEMHFMPPRGDCITHPQVYKYKKNQPPVYEFLKNGNCFLYHLPQNYTEGGPRVVIEAMAAGLPVICDNHSGMKDRVTDETGWRCNSYAEILDVIKLVSSKEGPAILEKMGNAARERARQEFVPENWIKHILEDI
jgi:ADP-heptose:LPS heptosyltransferase